MEECAATHQLTQSRGTSLSSVRASRPPRCQEPAQDETFVEIEGGVAPLGLQGRVMKAACPLFFKRWLVALVEALPKVVAGRNGVSPKQG